MELSSNLLVALETLEDRPSRTRQGAEAGLGAGTGQGRGANPARSADLRDTEECPPSDLVSCARSDPLR